MRNVRVVVAVVVAAAALVVILGKLYMFQDDVIVKPGGGKFSWSVEGNDTPEAASTLRDDVFEQLQLYRLCEHVFLGFGKKLSSFELEMTDGTRVEIVPKDKSGKPVLDVSLDDKSNIQEPYLDVCCHDAKDCRNHPPCMNSGIPEEFYKEVEQYRINGGAWEKFDEKTAPELQLDHGSCFWPG